MLCIMYAYFIDQYVMLLCLLIDGAESCMFGGQIS